jgi:hypothetical protein
MYHLTPKSTNTKTGPIPVSTSTFHNCPDSCPLRKSGCYADGGPLAIHWKKITDGERGTDFETFCRSIEGLPEDQVWRHNQAGDLPGDRVALDATMVERLTEANKGRRGFTYTHYAPVGENVDIIRRANERGFTVNLSADNLAEADEFMNLELPVVSLVTEDAPKVGKTPKGNRFVSCPAQHSETVNCSNCGGGKPLCGRRDRGFIVTFTVHGSGKKKAADVVNS